MPPAALMVLVVFAFVGFVLALVAAHVRANIRHRTEVQKALLAKFSSPQELTEFLNSDAGKLLLHATLAYALERGLERYELMGDVEPWKLEWTKAMEERVSLEAYRRTPQGLARYAAQAYLRPLVRRDPRRRLLER